MSLPNLSADLVWEITRSQNAFLVKRRTAGGVQFSRDPYNLANKNSRKHAGFVNDKALSIQPGENNGIQVKSKKIGSVRKPAKSEQSVTYSGGKTNRKLYKAVADQTAKFYYRPDLRPDAVARASAIRHSQRPVKPEPEQKLRGGAAKRAAEIKE